MWRLIFGVSFPCNCHASDGDLWELMRCPKHLERTGPFTINKTRSMTWVRYGQTYCEKEVRNCTEQLLWRGCAACDNL